MPVLGIRGSGYELLNAALPNVTSQLKIAKVEGSGHFLMEEKPLQTAQLMIDFLK